MNRDEAVDILMAYACCHVKELICADCPMWVKNKEKCDAWTDDDVVEAVRYLTN